jgi:hypothetical protein
MNHCRSLGLLAQALNYVLSNVSLVAYQEIHLGTSGAGTTFRKILLDSRSHGRSPKPTGIHKEQRDHWMEAICGTSGEGAEHVVSQIASNDAAGGPHTEEDPEDTWFDIEPEVVRGITISPEY